MSDRQRLQLDRSNRHVFSKEPGWEKLDEVRAGSTQSGALSRLRAVILLGGAVRATSLRSQIGRSVLDLPVDNGRTLMSIWRDECLSLTAAVDIRRLALRVILDKNSAAPGNIWPIEDRAHLSIERDPSEYRGTGGVLRDVAAGYEDDDHLLVGNAAELLCVPLSDLAIELAGLEADIALVSHRDGTPSGLMLVRCGCLREIARVGFVDLKEQALPAVARVHRVRVLERADVGSLPIRTVADYVEALQYFHRGGTTRAEDWRSRFSLIEDPSCVHPSARIHDSVVLRGGHVEEKAVVVNSVVCPGGVVRRGRVVSDELIAPA